MEGEGGPGLNFPLIESYGTLIYAYKLCRSNSQRPPWAPLVAAKAMNDRRQTASLTFAVEVVNRPFLRAIGR